MNMDLQENDKIITKQQTGNDNKFMYGVYITRIQYSTTNIYHQLFQERNTTISETMRSQCFELIRETTIDTKMKYFQFRFLSHVYDSIIFC